MTEFSSNVIQFPFKKNVQSNVTPLCPYLGFSLVLIIIVPVYPGRDNKRQNDGKSDWETPQGLYTED